MAMIFCLSFICFLQAKVAKEHCQPPSFPIRLSQMGTLAGEQSKNEGSYKDISVYVKLATLAPRPW